VLKGGEDGKVITPGDSKKSHLVIAVAQLDPDTAMPPKQGGAGGGGQGRGGGGFGGARGGGGGAGGARGQGMFGRGVLAQVMVTQGDKDSDQKLTKTEFTGLAQSWYDKIDSTKSGTLNQKDFTDRLGNLLAPNQTGGNGGGQGGGNGRAGGASYVMSGIFTAADLDKNGSVTRTEFESTFDKWFSQWDSQKAGSLNEEQLYAGLREVLPQQQVGGFGGGGGQGGQGGRAGGGGG
jgi:hypothetical protein